MLTADEACSAGKWLRYAKMEIDWALSQGLAPIVVGGTGLYIQALTQGMSDIPDIDPSVRAQSMGDYDAMGKDAFCERLRHIDPGFFERLKVYDKQRLVRAYEVWLGSGKPLSWWQAQTPTPSYPADMFNIIKILPPRDELYRRCDARFATMLEMGALDEVKQLQLLNLSDDLPVMKTIGLRELSAYLRGETTLEQAVILAQQATRNYAKRQMTWLRNQL